MSLSSKMSISVDENIKFFSLDLGSICNFERWQNLHVRILTLTIKGQITLSMNFFKYSLSAPTILWPIIDDVLCCAHAFGCHCVSSFVLLHCMHKLEGCLQDDEVLTTN